MAIRKSHVYLSLVNSYLIDSPQPSTLSYWYNLGSLLGLCLVIQIASGIFLAMHYSSHIELAFASVEHIMRDVNYGYLIRYIHANGASFFFICMYLHIGKALYYGSYKAPRTLLWTIGVIIFIVTMATAFMGYCLVYGQMSHWGGWTLYTYSLYYWIINILLISKYIDIYYYIKSKSYNINIVIFILIIPLLLPLYIIYFIFSIINNNNKNNNQNNNHLPSLSKLLYQAKRKLSNKKSSKPKYSNTNKAKLKAHYKNSTKHTIKVKFKNSIQNTNSNNSTTSGGPAGANNSNSDISKFRGLRPTYMPNSNEINKVIKERNLNRSSYNSLLINKSINLYNTNNDVSHKSYSYRDLTIHKLSRVFSQQLLVPECLNKRKAIGLYTPIDAYFISIIVGLLMGDAQLEVYKKTNATRLIMDVIGRYYINILQLHYIITNFGYSNTDKPNANITILNLENKKRYLYYNRYNTFSISNKLHFLYNYFYIKGHKVILYSILAHFINPISLAYFIMFNSIKINRTIYIFNNPNMPIIVEVIKDIFDIEILYNEDISYYYIEESDINFNKLYSIIKPHLLTSHFYLFRKGPSKEDKYN